MVSLWIKVGAAAMALGVALGAFGAHGLKDVLSEPMKTVFETGVRYQLLHGLALFVVAGLSLSAPSKSVTAAGILFTVGIVLFSGSLYMLALSGIKAWGAVTPLGGAAFILGWVCVAFL